LRVASEPWVTLAADLTYVDEKTRLRTRVAKIRALLEELHDLYDGLASRPEGAASLAGFDDQPRTRPCEHRREWKRGKLCLGCDNTGYRRIAKGEQEIDPYALDLPKTSSGVTLDESPGAKRARYNAHLDASLAKIAQAQRVQSGREAVEGRELAQVRVVSTYLKRRPSLVAVVRAVETLRFRDPELYAQLPGIKPLLWLANYPGIGRL